MWLLAVLTGERQLTRFFLYIEKKMYGRFAGPKRNGRNNEMVKEAVRRRSTVKRQFLDHQFPLIFSLPRGWFRGKGLAAAAKLRQVRFALICALPIKAV